MNPSEMLLLDMEPMRKRLTNKIAELQKITDSDRKYSAQETILKLKADRQSIRRKSVLMNLDSTAQSTRSQATSKFWE